MSQLLAIDLGTSSVKVLLADETGQILSQGSAEYPIRRPQPNWAEQNPDDWWRATITAVHQVVTDMRRKSMSIAAVGLSGQMHGVVLLDGRQQLLGPAIIWPDQRSQRQVQEITAQIGAERLIELTGSPVATGFQAATLRWLQQEDPGRWADVRAILLPKDYLRWRMTGEFHTDPSDGSGTLLFDVRQRDWSDEILTALEIDRAKLPPVQPSRAIAGELSQRAADALGLAVGIPVVTGAADTACAALGAGIVNPQTLLLTISTGGQLVLPTQEVHVDRGGRIHTFCAALIPGPNQPGWYQMGALLSAGMTLRWLRDEILGLWGEKAYTQMTSWAETVSPGARGLLFLPYLVGERTPYMDPQARGLFLGLTASHGQAELVRAVLEGVALACYDAYRVLVELEREPNQIIMAGGGARSQLWQQIIADVFALPVQRLEVGEQSALGALLLAGGGIDLFEPGAMAHEWAAYGPPIEPNPQRHALYQEILPIFRDAYQKHCEDFRELQKICASASTG
ncbi:MAG: xylulokinase [Anaerolineae bacterium]|nr:xylulokinase [Anaerolineae bacterium]